MRRSLFHALTFSLLVSSLVIAAPGAFAEDSQEHQGHQMNHAAMGMVDNSNEAWAQKLKGQTIVEDAMAGRANRSSLVEMQHNRLMEQMTRQVQVGQTTNTGMFNGMSTMHQYDGQGVRHLGHQRRNYVESVARYVSRLHVRPDGKSRKSPGRGSEE